MRDIFTLGNSDSALGRALTEAKQKIVQLERKVHELTEAAQTKVFCCCSCFLLVFL